MNERSNAPGHPRVPLVPLVVAGVAAVASIGLLAVMLWNAPMLVRLGLTGNLWYVLLLLLGLSAAVTVFALFKSYASYKGKVLHGTVEVGGPAVVMLLIVVLGFKLVPAPPARFDVTVFVHGEVGRQVLLLRNQGRLSLDLGADRRTERIGDKGEVRFIGIPNDIRDRRVAVTLDAEKYELVEPNLEVKLNQEVFYVTVRPKSVLLIGTVLNAAGRPLKGARVAMAGKTAISDADGRFELRLAADLPDDERTVMITAVGYEPWRAQAVPGGNPLQARLTAAK